jgi:hypothetical protein
MFSGEIPLCAVEHAQVQCQQRDAGACRIRHHQRAGTEWVMHALGRVVIPTMPHNGQAQRWREIDLGHADSYLRHGL